MKVQVVGADGRTRDKNFILDTGCNACMITDDLAQRLGLKTQPVDDGNGGTMRLNSASVQEVTVPQLSIGSLQVPNVPCAIISRQGLAGATGQTTEGVIDSAVDGVIGNNLLVAFAVLVDFQQNQVQFFRPGPITSADFQAVGMDKALPLTLGTDTNNETYMYTCRVQLETGDKSITKDLEIDIGSGTTMIDGQDAQKLGLPMKKAMPLTLVTGPTKMYEGKVTKVTLGDGVSASVAQVQDVTLMYPKGKLPDFLAAHLGRDVLSHYRILFDFADKKMYLAPLVPVPPPVAPTATPALATPSAKP